ncbi:MAG: tRNA (adenosine(37)-N6)-dimethylallyltransferase MiaA [Candidatus Levybacteria bacterium RIFCSPHIGHO2_01_FULL_40_15b]|nr:MAG: tRNA (adenosine(37)-N6)-dimethylallyltransferase MiaA [Candidatus Levybacteria bacterium RIFCSPHIGHO2_01_FULL_40_15b]
MKRALIIVGPTAVGKTDLAFSLSRAFPSVLISADSIQVYLGADIISGKDRSVETFFLDIVLPHKSFSVREFIEKVRPLIEKAKKENKIPIIVGGTGFYIDALFGKIDTISIPPNKALREKLEKLNVRKLQEKLKKLSLSRFYRMNNSDVNNKRRLVRAIEIAITRGPIPVRVRPLFKKKEVLIIGLKSSVDHLRSRIETRVEERIKKGAIYEAKRLFKDYEALSNQVKAANGYKQLFEYLKGKLTYDVAKEAWINSEVKTAKNQMTWFKRNKNIVWFDPVRSSSKRILYREILSLIQDFLGTSNGV